MHKVKTWKESTKMLTVAGLEKCDNVCFVNFFLFIHIFLEFP